MVISIPTQHISILRKAVQHTYNHLLNNDVFCVYKHKRIWKRLISAINNSQKTGIYSSTVIIKDKDIPCFSYAITHALRHTEQTDDLDFCDSDTKILSSVLKMIKK